MPPFAALRSLLVNLFWSLVPGKTAQLRAQNDFLRDKNAQLVARCIDLAMRLEVAEAELSVYRGRRLAEEVQRHERN